MTIAAAYLTSEGVVLGADSATAVHVQSAEGPASVAQILRHTQKVFEIGENSRFGICTWGAGSVNGTSHRVLVARLDDALDDGATVESAAAKLVDLVGSATGEEASKRGELGYYLGGYDSTGREPACFQIGFSRDGKSKIDKMEIGQARFSGAPQFFTRVFHGYDPRLPSLVTEILAKKLNDPPKDLEDIVRQACDMAPIKSVGFQDLPIREAIDWIHSYLHLTVKAFKFQFGVPICGGPIEVAFISADRRFRWVCHKPFDSAIREEEV